MSHDRDVSIVSPSCRSGRLTEKVLLGLGVGGDGLSGDLDRDPSETTETKSTCLPFFYTVMTHLIQMISELDLMGKVAQMRHLLAGSQVESWQVVSVEDVSLS